MRGQQQRGVGADELVGEINSLLCEELLHKL
jgi:hypothetical protein